MIDPNLIGAMEHVLAFDVEERKKKKKKENSSEMPIRDIEWRISQNSQRLICYVLSKAFLNNSNHDRTVFIPKLASLLIGRPKMCDMNVGWFPLGTLSEIIKKVSNEQVFLMVEM